MAQQDSGDASDENAEETMPMGYRSLRNPLPSNRRYRNVLWYERFNWLMLTLFALFSPIVLALVIGHVQNIPSPFSSVDLPFLH
ncbi:hypothetical protein [Kushneria marisflavi]|uniref:Uncharacterized protein n=1 Tax=Kushneria marisflavi TaxID=157779 RepID=A0A240ULE8_9GAMM|nr:hypothetical protein [Kushneria marisflavi]ART61903.1 hypothetical protein B9H00_01500 [Kushneria marisflavi]RKD86949.1 hypothetical protein C8D96_0403 [Kushneria marisflavi]